MNDLLDNFTCLCGAYCCFSMVLDGARNMRLMVQVQRWDCGGFETWECNMLVETWDLCHIVTSSHGMTTESAWHQTRVLLGIGLKSF